MTVTDENPWKRTGNHNPQWQTERERKGKEEEKREGGREGGGLILSLSQSTFSRIFVTYKGDRRAFAAQPSGKQRRRRVVTANTPSQGMLGNPCHLLDRICQEKATACSGAKPESNARKRQMNPEGHSATKGACHLQRHPGRENQGEAEGSSQPPGGPFAETGICGDTH